MAWTFNGTRIYTQKISDGVKAIIAKLQPLDAGTVYQSFGYETNKIKISAIVVGDGNKNALKDLTESGDTSYALVAPEGSLGNFYVDSVTANRELVMFQTIDTTQDCSAPVYTVEIELLEEIVNA
jgi:hypothetical protein